MLVWLVFVLCFVALFNKFSFLTHFLSFLLSRDQTKEKIKSPPNPPDHSLLHTTANLSPTFIISFIHIPQWPDSRDLGLSQKPVKMCLCQRKREEEARKEMKKEKMSRARLSETSLNMNRRTEASQ